MVWNTLASIALLAFPFFAVLAVLALLKKNGKVKKWAVYTGISLAAFVIAAVNAPFNTSDSEASKASESEIPKPKSIVEMQEESLSFIESELINLNKNLTYYQEASKLLNIQVQWLNEKLVPYSEELEMASNIADKATTVSTITRASLTPVGMVSKMATMTLGEVSEKTKTLKEFVELESELNNSINKIKSLEEQYYQTKDVKLLEQINIELTTNYLYIVRELDYFTRESIDLFESFSNLLYQYENIKVISSDVTNKLAFWEDSNEENEDETGKQTLEQLQDNLEKIKKVPEEIKIRSKQDNAYVMNIQAELLVVNKLNNLTLKE